MKLVNKTTGEEIKVGDTAWTFRGSKVTIRGIKYQNNRVYTIEENGTTTSQYFPEVINAKWVESDAI